MKLLVLSGKSLNVKNATIAVLQTQVTHLQAELKAKKSNRRRTIRENPNDTFIKIEAIRESQRGLQEMVEAEEEVPDLEEDGDCIIVR